MLQSESLYIYIYPHVIKINFPYRPLQSIESSLCSVLISYLFYIYIVVYIYVSPNLPVYPLVTISLFSTSMTLLLFCK